MATEDRGPGHRFDEVTDAATRAFRLLPAASQDGAPPARSAIRRITADPIRSRSAA